jgi:hypothetical protein
MGHELLLTFLLDFVNYEPIQEIQRIKSNIFAILSMDLFSLTHNRVRFIKKYSPNIKKYNLLEQYTHDVTQKNRFDPVKDSIINVTHLATDPTNSYKQFINTFIKYQTYSHDITQCLLYIDIIVTILIIHYSEPKYESLQIKLFEKLLEFREKYKNLNILNEFLIELIEKLNINNYNTTFITFQQIWKRKHYSKKNALINETISLMPEFGVKYFKLKKEWKKRIKY